MGNEEIVVQKVKQKKQSAKIVIIFSPDSNFEEEFLEFVEKILNWKENFEGKQKIEDKKNERK
ncbi:MAG: hypothetical protein QXO40_03180 [Candidatus Aenigmatarchaeota archaeon]